MHGRIRELLRFAAAGSLLLAGTAFAQTAPGAGEMTFFVTSAGLGKGADLGGLEGADRHCQSLAQAAGAGNRTWRAYLSKQASAPGASDFVNARDRIGTGPWRNAKGVGIANSVDELHSDKNNVNKQTALDERGQTVPGAGDSPNKHDILTGSRTDGTTFSPHIDLTCGNWTKSGPDGAAMTGHHDRRGPPAQVPWTTSWNSSHPTRGCHQEGLRSTGGDGLFYCFAAK